MLPPVRLSEYLPSLNVEAARTPPLVHSTSVHRVFDILHGGKILAMRCSVFTNDKLCYFFVGRPAYKGALSDAPATWQLPMSFVMRFREPPPIKRVFPFDSGAFVQKRLPDYITMFDLNGYEISGHPENIGRLISFYFKTPKRYMEKRANGEQELKEEHSLGPRHQEISALHRLYLEQNSTAFDDRSAAVEIQISADVPLLQENVLGVVIPDEYGRDPEIMAALRAITPNVETYRHWPNNALFHYALIYEGVSNIYRKFGLPL